MAAIIARNWECLVSGVDGGGKGRVAAVQQKVAINCAKSVRLKKAKSVPSSRRRLPKDTQAKLCVSENKFELICSTSNLIEK